jgi:small subunit ribosomal protein S6e
MAEFKAVISDPKSGKTYQAVVSGQHANSLVGKKIGDEFDGIFVSLPGYKLVVTGGSDKDGFPMRKELQGTRRRKLLISKSQGFRPKDKGVRRRKSVRGNTISTDTIQINMKITTYGSKPIEDALKQTEENKE